MGMAADKKIRRRLLDCRLHPRAISAGVATNVCHPYINRFASEPQMFWISGADILPIYVALHAFRWIEGNQRHGPANMSAISSMPYFIAPTKLGTDLNSVDYGKRVSVR